MLVEERASLRDLRDEVTDAADRAAGQASRQHQGEAAIAALILLASRRMAEALAIKIHRATVRARELGAERLRVELRAAGALRASGRVRLVRPSASDVHATTSADSLALAWRTRTVRQVQERRRKGEPITGAIATSSGALDASVRRTVATETARAYNDGHREAAAELAQPYRTPGNPGDPWTAPDDAAFEGDFGLELAEGLMLVDRWDAILDSRSCSICRGLDGSLVLPGQTFDSGEEPGYVHPWCRCIRTTIAIARH